VAVLLATDPEIAEAHQRFLGLAGPTDVMSWQSGEPVAAPGAFLGDVMVSCHTALRQAEELGHRWDREVCVLAVHGVLHLLGWDDQTPQDRACMQARVDAIVDAT
jgi:probable rRNA maturation factor